MGVRLTTLNAGGSNASSGFLPSDVSGLKVWCEADYQTYQDSAGSTPATANNDPIGRWTDRSGNGNHLIQTSNSLRPALKTSEQNGRNGILYTDGNDLSLASFSTILGLGGGTFFAVMQVPSGGYTTIYDANVSASRFSSLFMPSSFYGTYFTGAGVYAGSFTAGARTVSVATFDATNTFSFEVYDKSTNLDSGLFVGSGTGGESTLHVGLNTSSGGSNFASYYFALIIYSGKLSATDRGSVLTYLTGRWGV